MQRRFGKCPTPGCSVRVVDNGNLPLGDIPSAPGVYSDEHIVKGGGIERGYCCTIHFSSIEWSGVKATRGQDECGAVCWEATGARCKCSCNGVDHGSRV